ncbi:hypothetical protein [Streptomyces sp. NPDC059909]|uniref:hypothetical protein n=1 Tax=Streptomyces sp. NPDC059909 TaxID=3346998 RepID=UPI00365A586F
MVQNAPQVFRTKVRLACTVPKGGSLEGRKLLALLAATPASAYATTMTIPSVVA